MKQFFSKYWLLCLFLIAFVVLGYNIYTRAFQKELHANLEALDEGSWGVVAQKAVDKYVDKPLILPYVDSMYMSELEYQYICNLPFKIVNFLDGDCSTCLIKVGFWKEFISDMNVQGYGDIPIVMYSHSSFEANMRDYMNTQWNEQYPWQFDKNQSFIIDNELYDLRLQTVLLDSDNKVILIGDPLLNPTLRKLYMETIKSLL